ncbi:hypothetical protein DPMN_178344 [Dreissena polymorpha]|uniref:Uncharacterized protein n=1 Tax=Dreissena polymorpha TaxID=45954 RepID=A0A9D4EEV2_DREPO|nr:hypothetical protein DPMN_178344 [Dreissena polymorpha]
MLDSQPLTTHQRMACWIPSHSLHIRGWHAGFPAIDYTSEDGMLDSQPLTTHQRMACWIPSH